MHAIRRLTLLTVLGLSAQATLLAQEQCLSAGFAGTDSANGLMFDLTTQGDQRLTRLVAHMETGVKSVDVYTRAGTHVGHENSSAGWSQLGPVDVSSKGEGAPTEIPLLLGIDVPSGETRAFYLRSRTVGKRLLYGSSSNASSTELALGTATALSGAFSTAGSKPSGAVNGRVCYGAAATGLLAAQPEVSQPDGGSMGLLIDAGSAAMGDTYLVLGADAASASSSGTSLGGGLKLPFVFDAISLGTLEFANASVGGVVLFESTLGVLDSDGRAAAKINVPAGSGNSGLIGRDLLFCFVVLDAAAQGAPSFASQAVTLSLVDAPAAPVASFTSSSTSGCDSLTVSFAAGSSGGEVTGWRWDFDGDGVSDSSEENPVHTFSSPGDYPVQLTVAGPGGSDVELKSNHVEVNASPSASFTPSVMEGPLPLEVTFVNNSSGSVSSYTWDFDDGETETTSAKLDQVHIFEEAGDYWVTLDAKGSGTCGDDVEQVLIKVRTPTFGDVYELMEDNFNLPLGTGSKSCTSCHDGGSFPPLDFSSQGDAYDALVGFKCFDLNTFEFVQYVHQSSVPNSAPESFLVEKLLKPSPECQGTASGGQMPQGGSEFLSESDPAYVQLMAWIDAGAKND